MRKIIIEGWTPWEKFTIDLKEFYKYCDLYVKQKKALDNFKGFKYMPSEYYDIIYYALIELPSGRHVPLPILLEKYGVTSTTLRKIPVSKKIRDDNFFVTECGTGFYKCYTDKDYENFRETSKVKELTVMHLISTGQFKKLKLILPNIYKRWSDCWCDDWDDEWDDWDEEDEDYDEEEY